jgi:hypothetical protein
VAILFLQRYAAFGGVALILFPSVAVIGSGRADSREACSRGEKGDPGAVIIPKFKLWS